MLKQRFKNETFLGGILIVCILSFIFVPFAEHILMAQSLTDGPVIAHYPRRVGRYGQKFTIRVHAASDAQLQKVNLVLLDGEQPLRGSLPVISGAGVVPVRVMATRNTAIRSKTDATSNVRAVVAPGDVLNVSSMSNGYYRVMDEEGKKGYVSSDAVDILTNGLAFGVSLPPSLTERSRLTYQIEAVDARGNVTSTEPVKVRLLTNQEIEQLLAMFRGGSQPTGPVAGQKAFYQQPLVWGGVALAGGLAYFLLSDGGEEEQEQAILDVMVTWE